LADLAWIAKAVRNVRRRRPRPCIATALFFRGGVEVGIAAWIVDREGARGIVRLRFVVAIACRKTEDRETEDNSRENTTNKK
jgi:hypothetical protein